MREQSVRAESECEREQSERESRVRVREKADLIQQIQHQFL